MVPSFLLQRGWPRPGRPSHALLLHRTSSPPPHGRITSPDVIGLKYVHKNIPDTVTLPFTKPLPFLRRVPTCRDAPTSRASTFTTIPP
ncbi:hypothetical protein E2C01_018364 [Portunus trituberculatus]|uniref:Uncharacterized protein n=1 Tax=Portunus trituberculatus TaxID=210409 RepID=A0A5B7DVY1_PORTR|nr:hypothetical protein [Portunus trituberculatus]